MLTIRPAARKSTRKPIRRTDVTPNASTVRPRKSDVWPSEISELWYDNGEQDLTAPLANECKRMRLLLANHLNSNCTTLKEYLKTKKSNFSIRGNPLLVASKNKTKSEHQYNFVTVLDSAIFDVCIYDIKGNHSNNFMNFEEEVASGEKIPLAVIKEDSLIINGDDMDGAAPDINLNTIDIFKDSPTVSFVAIALLLGYISDPEEDIDMGENEFIKDVSFEIASDRIVLLDFKPDQKMPETRKNVIDGFHEAKRNKKKVNGVSARRDYLNSLTPPSPGFTLMDSSHGKLQWHRASTCIISHKMTSKAKKTDYWLIGMDEGAYFGCVLKDSVKNIEEAFNSLMPAAARNSSGFIRQGEWFAVPISEKEVPSLLEAIYFGEGNASICLPVQDERSNRHYVCVGESSSFRNSMNGEFRLNKKGTLFARGFSLVHKEPASEGGYETGEHEDLNTPTSSQWYTFHENTALRSVSLGNGVD